MQQQQLLGASRFEGEVCVCVLLRNAECISEIEGQVCVCVWKAMTNGEAPVCMRAPACADAYADSRTRALHALRVRMRALQYCASARCQAPGHKLSPLTSTRWHKPGASRCAALHYFLTLVNRGTTRVYVCVCVCV